MQNKIPIAFICDETYVMPTAVAITSLLYNKNPDTYYDIHVITTGLTEESINIFEKFKGENIGISILKASTAKYEKYQNCDSIYLVASIAALLKFELPSLIPYYTKVLYLDGDVMILSDLSELYENDIEGYYAGVVRDIPQVLFKKPLIGVNAGKSYFNSGMMLLNLHLMRNNNIYDTLVETKRTLPDKSLMDQNVFNIVFYGKVKQLPLKYNLLYINLLRSIDKYTIEDINNIFDTNFNELDDVKKEAQIIHFSSEDKPWKYYDVSMSDMWLGYYLLSPFKNYKLERQSSKEKNETVHSMLAQTKKESLSAQAESLSVVPIVFSADENYAPYLGVAIQSVIETGSTKYFYDIYIFHYELSDQYINRLEAMETGNVRIKCLDVGDSIKKEDLYSRAHYSIEMYFRILIPEILFQYDKVLYLDCDLVVLNDVAELYKYDLGDNILGAANNIVNRNMEKYITHTLGISVEEYINSGVLLINTKKFLEANIKEKCFVVLTNMPTLWCPDQDILNITCNKNILFLEDAWNFQWQHIWPENSGQELIELYKERFKAAYANHYIVHYTSVLKPWIFPGKEMANYFWEYARKTPFYEQIIYNNAFPRDWNRIRNDIYKAQKEMNASRNEINYVYHSLSFRVGRAITLFPRKVCAFIRCWEEHGFEFTIDKVKAKLGVSRQT